MVYEEARRWYGLYGSEDKLRYFVGPGPHGTPRETREEIYAWMIRWLNGGKGDAREQDIPLYPDHELQVTSSGQVEQEPGSRKLYQVILDEFKARHEPRGIPELKTELLRLGIATDRRPPGVERLGETQDGDIRRVELNLTSQPGINLRAALYLPSLSGRKPGLLVVRDGSSAALARTAAQQGFVSLELEPRTSPSGDDRRPYLGEWLTNSRANSVGLNLPALRAHDLLRGVDYLASLDDVDATAIRGVARDVRGIWLLLAAAVDSRISELWLDRTPYSLAAAMRQPLNTNLFDAVIPGFLLHWDLPDLMKALGARRVIWSDPSNWMNRIVPLGPPFTYRTAQHTDDFFLAMLRSKEAPQPK